MAMQDPDNTWWAICLCAAWCGVCRDWRAAFTGAARAHPEWHFAWVDIEDEAEALGEVDIETFPTLLLARGDEALFLGALPPSTAQLERLAASLQAQPARSPALPPEADSLLARLHRSVLARTRI